jgi:exopolyphosphatase/guanosine-5'-triphosphate,3'-diphosphate pyrophosphatase
VTETVAALDCGSNSTRLLISSRDHRTNVREMRITRLSQGVDATGALTPEARQRTYAVLDEYRALMDDYDVSRGLLVATSAVRDAVNGGEFLDEARRRTGVDAVVLTGEQEAWYSYNGAMTDLSADTRPTVIVDIGGGSTELAVVIDGSMHSYSMQLGCVRVTERALGRDVVTPASDAAARSMIDAEMDRAWAAQPVFATLSGRVRLVGLAGTVATLAQLDAGITVYDRDVVHHRVLTRQTVERWRTLLARESPTQRLARPGMVAGREDVLTAGLYVLETVMDRLGVGEVLSSECDILDGVCAWLWDEHRA